MDGGVEEVPGEEEAVFKSGVGREEGARGDDGGGEDEGYGCKGVDRSWVDEVGGRNGGVGRHCGW